MKQILKLVTGILFFYLAGCSGGGGGGSAASTTPPADSPTDPTDLSVTSNKIISTYATDICTQYANEACYFNGGQVVKYSDGSTIIMGSFLFVYGVAGDIDTDTNTASLIIPSTSTGAYIRLNQFVARGGGYKNLYLVYEKSPETVGLMVDTDGDGVLEATDETVTTLTLSSW